MPLQQLFTSRKVYDAETFVGQEGKLFYDEATGLFRLGNGSTPGGKIVGNLAIAAIGTSSPIDPYPGELWYDPTTKELWAYYNGSFRGTINPATTSTIGGIKAGPGIVVASDGTVSLDSTGIPFNFGDFYAFTNNGPSDGACLSSINPNQDINVVSNGTGTVNIVGEFAVHKTNETLEDALTALPVLSISSQGKIRVLAPNAGGLTGAVEVIGSSTGTIVSPNQTGVVVHITGNQDMVSRNYIDGVNNYSLLVGRRYNGTAASPTNVKNGELFFRIAGQASTGTSFSTFGPGQIDWVATEDQGPNNQGGEIRIRATPNGLSASAGIVQVASFNATTGVTAIKFNGPLNGNVLATTVTATNLVGQLSPSSQLGITTVGTLTNVSVSGNIRYDVTQNNSTATQLTSKSNTVVCNGRTGQITMSNSSIAKGEAITFTVTNSAVTAVTDVPVVVIQSGASPNSYTISVTRVQVGSFNVTLTNNGTGALTDTLIINFAIIKVS